MIWIYTFLIVEASLAIIGFVFLFFFLWRAEKRNQDLDIKKGCHHDNQSSNDNLNLIP